MTLEQFLAGYKGSVRRCVHSIHRSRHNAQHNGIAEEIFNNITVCFDTGALKTLHNEAA